MTAMEPTDPWQLIWRFSDSTNLTDQHPAGVFGIKVIEKFENFERIIETQKTKQQPKTARWILVPWHHREHEISFLPLKVGGSIWALMSAINMARLANFYIIPTVTQKIKTLRWRPPGDFEVVGVFFFEGVVSVGFEVWSNLIGRLVWSDVSFRSLCSFDLTLNIIVHDSLHNRTICHHNRKATLSCKNSKELASLKDNLIHRNNRNRHIEMCRCGHFMFDFKRNYYGCEQILWPKIHPSQGLVKPFHIFKNISRTMAAIFLYKKLVLPEGVGLMSYLAWTPSWKWAGPQKETGAIWC